MIITVIQITEGGRSGFWVEEDVFHFGLINIFIILVMWLAMWVTSRKQSKGSPDVDGIKRDNFGLELSKPR